MRTPIAIVGMGISGTAAEKLLLAMGIAKSDIFLFDEKVEGVDYKNYTDLMNYGKPQTLVVSPGYALNKPWIQKAKQNGIAISSELAIAIKLLKNEQIIGITGSLGKSTVVSLLGEAAKTAQEKAFVGGNLGTPLADYVRTTYYENSKNTPVNWVILELSSYQLENCGELQCSYSGFTYFAPNHLERYPNLQTYYSTKWELAKRTSNKIFCNSKSSDLMHFIQNRAPDKIPSNKIISTDDSNQHNMLSVNELLQAKLLGKHNQDNLLLAATIATACNWNSSYKEGLLNFSGLPHRIQNIGTFQKIRFINDSKSTTLQSVESAIRTALEYVSGSNQLVVLLGGKDKNLPWENLAFLKTLPSAKFLFFGSDGILIQKKTKLPGEYCSSLAEAIEKLKEIAKEGDTVLLSPGGTSLDEFKNFEERGNFFKKKVEELFPKN